MQGDDTAMMMEEPSAVFLSAILSSEKRSMMAQFSSVRRDGSTHFSGRHLARMEGSVPEYPTEQSSSHEGKKQKSPNMSTGIEYRYEAFDFVCDIHFSRSVESRIMAEWSGRPSAFQEVRKVAI